MSIPETTRPVVKAVCCTPRVSYWIKAGGKTIAIALAMSNYTWALYSCGGAETRLSPKSFKTPQSVATEAKRLGMLT
jgi:hypothetical protein